MRTEIPSLLRGGNRSDRMEMDFVAALAGMLSAGVVCEDGTGRD